MILPFGNRQVICASDFERRLYVLVDDNAARAGSLGLMEIIKSAMERHASSEQVLVRGLDALSNICENGTCTEYNAL